MNADEPNLQLRVALAELLNRYQELRLDPHGSVQFSSGLGQCIISLPLLLGPANT
jgi:hypothetical protein